MIESFFACVNLIDEIDQLTIHQDDQNEQNQIVSSSSSSLSSSLSQSRSHSPSSNPSISSSSTLSSSPSPSPSLSGLVLTDDEIISLINDFDYDLHSSHRVISSLIISAKCNDYRPSKAILLTLLTHSLTLFGHIHEALSTCRGIVEVLKAHSKKPSIVMLIYGVVLSLLLNESNQMLFIESGIHRELATTFKKFLWKFDSKDPLETQNLSLCCWRILLISLFSNQNLEARRIFGEYSICESIVQILSELLLLSSHLSLSPTPSISKSHSSLTSSTTLSPPPITSLLNIFVVSCCGSLLSLSRDYDTNFQRIVFSSIFSPSSSSVIIPLKSLFEEILRPSLRMCHSILTDDSWNVLSLTQQYFFSKSPTSIGSLTFPPVDPTFPPILMDQSQSISSLSQSIHIFLLKFTPSHEYYKSILSLALTDLISFLQFREISSTSSHTSPDIKTAFSPHYIHLTTALEIFTALAKYQHTETIKLNAQLLLTRYNYSLQTNSLQQIQNEIQEISSKYQSDLSLSTELSHEYAQKITALNSLHSELSSLQKKLESVETEHQQITNQLQETQEMTTEQINKFHELELEQVKTVAAIMNERARVELELDEISFKHKTEINKIQDIFTFSSIAPSSLSFSGSTQNINTHRRSVFPEKSKNQITSPPLLCVSEEEAEGLNILQNAQNESSTTFRSAGSYDKKQTTNVLNRVKSLLTSTTTRKNVHQLSSQCSQSKSPVPSNMLPNSDQRPPPPLFDRLNLLELAESLPPPPSTDISPDRVSPPPYFTFTEIEARPSANSTQHQQDEDSFQEAKIHSENYLVEEKSQKEIKTEMLSKEKHESVDLDKILKLTALYSKKKNSG